MWDLVSDESASPDHRVIVLIRVPLSSMCLGADYTLLKSDICTDKGAGRKSIDVHLRENSNGDCIINIPLSILINLVMIQFLKTKPYFFGLFSFKRNLIFFSFLKCLLFTVTET